MSIPYYVVIFTSVMSDDSADYGAFAERMEALVKAQPGYLGMEHYHGQGAERVTICYWEKEGDLKSWKEVPEHAAVQAEGIKRWYASYKVEVARVERAYGSGPSEA